MGYDKHDEHDQALDRLRTRLLRGMGLPAALGVALAGCAPDGVQRSEPGDAPLEPLRDLPVHPGSGEADPAVAPPDYDMKLTQINTPAVRHVQVMRLRRAPPGARTVLVAGSGIGISTIGGWEVGLADAEIVAETETDPDGRAEFRWLRRPDVPGAGTLWYQAFADDGETLWHSPRLRIEEQTVSTDWPMPEAHPGTDPSEIVAGQWFRACIPAAFYGDCPDATQLTAWQVLDVVSYALDDALPGELSAQACVTETAFLDDCCYGVATWAVSSGSPPPDNCDGIAPQNDNNGGGGGGWYGGRPFTVEDEVRVAEVRVGTGWADPVGVRLPADAELRRHLVAAWVGTARVEHASVASFSRFNLELMALGAPSELVARSTAAAADEIRHARICFGVASALSGAPVEVGRMPMGGALPAEVDPEAMLRAAILEGCIEETIASVAVREAARRCLDPVVAALLAEIAEDETRHAELSWAAVRWMIARDPSLREVARRTFADHVLPPVPAHAGPPAEQLAAHGVLAETDRAELAHRVFHAVVLPCARALLGEEEVASC